MTLQNKINTDRRKFDGECEIKCAVCKDTLYVDNPADYRTSEGYICLRCNPNMLNIKGSQGLVKN